MYEIYSNEMSFKYIQEGLVVIHQVRPLEGDKTAGAAHGQGWRQQGGQQGGRRDRRQGISQVEENVRKTILKRKSSYITL